MHLDAACIDQNVGRRRLFWTSRPQACGSYNLCGIECSIPGLEYEDSDEKVVGGRTIKNDEWLKGLIINILNTRARTDAKCPAPSAVYGHWSESYRDDNLWVGSRMWNAAEKPYIRILDAVNAIGAAVRADMSKLVALQLCSSVDVQASYAGRNRVDIVITAFVSRASHVLNLSGTFASDTWVWN